MKLALTAGIAALLSVSPAPARDEPLSSPTLRTKDIVALAARFRRYSPELPPAAQLGVETITAFEEHPSFVYVRGRGAFGDRRFVLLKPSTFIVFDTPAGERPWRLVCERAPSVSGDRFAVASGTSVIRAQALLAGARIRAARAGGSPAVEIDFEGRAARKRYVCALDVGSESDAAPVVEVEETAAGVSLKSTDGKRVFRLALPADPGGTGTIALTDGGQRVLPERILADGILPHGEEGVGMLARWDSAYRRERAPGWDVGRAATALRQAVERGDIRPGRALVLGCGAGTNAVYLATKGFDVTGIDLAPTALAIAARRARAAGVKVRWLLADVLAVPDVGRFDLVFDRGCYHHVRTYDAAGYVATLNGRTGPGARALILAGNANEPRHYGPPRVAQTDIVADFSGSWDVVRLEEIRFDSRDPSRTDGPWAWAILLRHKERAD